MPSRIKPLKWYPADMPLDLKLHYQLAESLEVLAEVDARVSNKTSKEKKVEIVKSDQANNHRQDDNRYHIDKYK